MENLNLIKPEKVQNIINKFCYTIGMIPTSYKVSLTYEEQIIAIGHYLEETVIPALNNNAEAVAELQNLFIELKNYVNNYFDNLDVQEEINNKLDQMVADGTLPEIVAAYLNSNAIIAFDNVESMKNATNLINGSFAKTLGYYSKNDGGDALYKITSTKSETEYQETLNNGLYATLIINDSINVKQLGAYGDGIHDDTEILQKIINMNKPIIFDDSTYMINKNGLLLINNTRITFNNTILKMITNNSSGYNILNINKCNNVNILGNAYLIGDKETHTGETGEFGHALSIIGSSNVNIENVQCSYGWGDGCYIGPTDDLLNNPNNIIINNLVCHHNRRNGLSITSGSKIIINNLITYNNGGTSPNGGFDIEPYNTNNVIDITINNIYSYSNGITGTGYQGFISNAYTDNYNVKIGTLKLDGVLSVTVSKEKSIVNIDDLIENIQSTQTSSVLIMTMYGLINIKNCLIDISNAPLLTDKNLIYSEKMLNTFIDNLSIINNGQSNPYFITNSNTISNFNINNLNYIGLLKISNTRNTNIHISNIIKRNKTLTSQDNVIYPFMNNIIISEEIANISYNDIAQYDGYEMNIYNSNQETTCTFSLNNDRFLYNGSKVYSISLPPSSYAKIRFDLFSHLYVVEYLYTNS
jgi:hypothetical protein